MPTAFLVEPSGRKYFLSSTAPTLIGSLGCSVLLLGVGIEPQHARICQDGTGGFQVESVHGAVYVNRLLLTGSAGLQPGDHIQIGSVELTYSGPTSTSTASLSAAKAAAKLYGLPSGKLPGSPVIPKKAAAALKPRLAPVFLRVFAPKKSTPQLVGHILLVDGPYEETPDVDSAGMFLRLFGGLFLLPFLCWQPALIIPTMMYGLGQRNHKVPVRYLRVEDVTGQQYVVRMKGEPVRGSALMGDDIEVWGRWSGGTLIMGRAINQKTNSQIVLKPNQQRKRSQITLWVLVAILVILWLVSMFSMPTYY